MSVLGPIVALNVLAAAQGLEPPADGVELAETEVRYVSAIWSETVIRGRPWVPHKRVATVAKGTRLVVRGQIESRDKKGCDGKPWYGVFPFGFVCSKHVRPTDKAPDLGAALPVAPGRRLPHTYAVVRHDGVPMYTTEENASLGIVDRTLTKSMTLVVRRSVNIDGQRFVETTRGKLVPKDGVGYMGDGSEWRGVYVVATERGPLFGWVRKDKTPVYAEPASGGARLRTMQKRERVPLLEPSDPGPRPKFWRIGPGEWMGADAINEVHITAPPPSIALDYRKRAWGNDQWIDVDLGEQVLIAYRGDEPVYATLVSSGRGSPTPRGNYPIWAKVASMDMANQDYEDKPYMVQGVPWVLLFQGHNALHGAYWHNRFGNRKSHGCVNLAPQDARWVFEWVGPTLPAGWTGYLPSDLDRSVMVHVRDSSRPSSDVFTQDRQVGPPDREAERKKSDAAQRRRAEMMEDAMTEASEMTPAATAPQPAPSRITPPPGPTLVPEQ